MYKIIGQRSNENGNQWDADCGQVEKATYPSCTVFNLLKTKNLGSFIGMSGLSDFSRVLLWNIKSEP